MFQVTRGHLSQGALEFQMRQLIYTDSDLVTTPIIDNPKVCREGVNLGAVCGGEVRAFSTSPWRQSASLCCLFTCISLVCLSRVPHVHAVALCSAFTCSRSAGNTCHMPRRATDPWTPACSSQSSFVYKVSPTGCSGRQGVAEQGSLAAEQGSLAGKGGQATQVWSLAWCLDCWKRQCGPRVPAPGVHPAPVSTVCC